MIRGKRAGIWLGTLVAAATILYLLPLRPSGGGNAAQMESTAKRGQGQDPAGDATPLVPAAGRRPAPLPAVDAPLAIILEPLTARADSGDTKAACRLALELIRCQSLAVFETIPGFYSDESEAALEKKGDLDAADQLATAQIRRVRLTEQCRTVPSHLRDRGGHYLGQAARAGEPEAMVRYADAQSWRPDARGIYADPEYDRWRRDAPAILQRAFAAGVPESPFVLMDAYQHDFSAVGSLIGNDPVKAEALYLLMVRLHGWQERLKPSKLDASSLKRANALAKQWHEGPFKGRSYRGQDRSTFTHAALPKRGDLPQEFCASDRVSP